MFKARFGLAKPSGSNNLAQGVPQPCPSQSIASLIIYNSLEYFSKFYRQINSIRKYDPVSTKPDSYLPHKPSNLDKPTAAFTYDIQIYIGILNCRDLSGKQSYIKKEILIDNMKRLNLDILLLQETYVNTNSAEIMDGFSFIFSTDVTDAQRKEAKKQKTAERRMLTEVADQPVVSEHRRRILNMAGLEHYYHLKLSFPYLTLCKLANGF